MRLHFKTIKRIEGKTYHAGMDFHIGHGGLHTMTYCVASATSDSPPVIEVLASIQKPGNDHTSVAEWNHTAITELKRFYGLDHEPMIERNR